MAANDKTDWEGIEAEYRAGQLSIREIGRQYCVSHEGIRKRAKTQHWTRDLSKRVRNRVRSELVRSDAAEVAGTSAVNQAATPVANGNVGAAGAETLIEAVIGAPPENSGEVEEGVVQAAAMRGVEVVRGHRRDIGQARSLVGLLATELQIQSTHVSELEEFIEQETQKDPNPKRRMALLATLTLPQRSATLRNLGQTLRALIPLERQAFNLDEETSDLPYEERLKKLLEDGESARGG